MTDRRLAKVSVDGSLCVGTRMCGVIAPEVFEFDEATGVSHAILELSELDDTLLDAGINCPVGAVRLSDPETGEEIPTV